jgi:hypothetical protein
MATKSKLGASVPKPAMQGGHGSSAAVTQKTAIQKKAGPAKTGSTKMNYSVQPAGTKGSSKGAK